MWYNRLSEYLKSQGYVYNELSPRVFIKKSHSGFAIVAIYVDNMNLIGTPAELEEIASHLKSKFEMKNLGKTRYYRGLEIEHCSNGILMHQSNYTQKVLCRFNEDKVKPSSTSMVVGTLDSKRDPFCPNEDKEEILEPEVPYVSAIRALLYLAQCTRPDISFAGNTDLGLFYTCESSSVATRYSTRIDSRLVGYTDAGYLSDPHRARSQTTSHECFWLREVMKHIRRTSGLTSVIDLPTTIFEDNTACIEQLKKGYIKGDNTKHIAPKFFCSHQQQQHQNIEVKQIRSQYNLADLFTKSLPKIASKVLVNRLNLIILQIISQTQSAHEDEEKMASSEAIAAREGLIWAVNKGFQKSQFVSDLLQIVETSRDSSINLSLVGQIVEDIKTLLLTISKATFTHTH
ncbi:hypothetical protein D8674_037115 [Pyrus ussuriensis x Pyrus communis]|uniref:Reverse transcriptase Ty1/copia-type domain-containing protein n=1 Tax=Pyrus ussuriensis x Pyrus communis TaxID=2448454 RepID=A0A5N5FNU3_9ROSA|nr:hypothetical protein D8674_037115 [Pyrus ussuriensis x Pyrus communis]